MPTSTTWWWSSSISTRRIGPGDAAALRAIRLRALADTPTAFAIDVDVEAAHPDSYWSEFTGSAAVFVAEREGDWVGVAVGRWYDREAGVAQLSGLWVDPAMRSRGLGGRLVDEVHGWAAVAGARGLRLGIIIDGPDVEGFYPRLGFERTGETRPLSFDRSRTARFLARPVPIA